MCDVWRKVKRYFFKLFQLKSKDIRSNSNLANPGAQ